MRFTLKNRPKKHCEGILPDGKKIMLYDEKEVDEWFNRVAKDLKEATAEDGFDVCSNCFSSSPLCGFEGCEAFQKLKELLGE